MDLKLNKRFVFLIILTCCFVPSKAQSFTEVVGTNFIPTTFNTVDFIDIDGDGDMDFIQTGKNPVGGRAARLYINDGSGNFTLLPGNQLTAVMYSDVAFGDFNGDGTMDILISGSTTQNGTASTRIYFNNGQSGLDITFSVSEPFTAFYHSAIDVADIDNDGDLDVLLSGWTGSNRVTELYNNNGTGNFTLVENTPFTALTHGTINFFDADGDGDADVLTSGNTGPAQATELYLNDGLGNFTKVDDNFIDLRQSACVTIDIDQDGDIDILMTGFNGEVNTRYTRLYLNDGSGNFTNSSSTFTGINSGGISVVDINNDDHLDIIICGYANTGSLTQIYLNNASNGFFLASTNLISAGNSAIASADVDNDGDNDIIISGWADELGNSGEKMTRLYKNDLITFGSTQHKLIPVSIYPNPTTNFLTINAANDVIFDAVEIYNLKGQKIETFKLTPSNKIDVSSLQNGLYILKLFGNNNFYGTSKFIKN